MDVDAHPRQFRRDLVGKDLHVAREHDEIGPGLLDQVPDRRFLFALGLFRHRQVMKGDLAEIEIAIGLARMIGDDRGRDHFQLTGTPAVENIGEAVIGFGDQQHHPAAVGPVAHLPGHAEALGDRGEAGLQRRQFDASHVMVAHVDSGSVARRWEHARRSLSLLA